ncbi:MAG: hypothetical protein IKH05_03655, partial [Bacteroidaceae bacterium]|nr:hypothetical protein [Bacteroidaceae bacterium]
LFIERAALPCFRHRLGLCLLVSKLPSAPFQSTDPFCRTSLSQQINRKHQSYQYRNIDDGNSRWVLDASAQLLSISMIYNLLDFRLLVSDANPTVGGDGVFALGR